MLFKDVIGQSNAKKKLIQSVQQNKISHAHLFTGDYGYGTLVLALAFSQYVLCENKKKTDSCGKCASCTKVQDLQHPDLHFSFPSVQSISKTSNSLYGDWREQIKTQAYFSSFDWTKRIDVKERKPIISVDESIEIQKKLRLKSYEGGYKIMIIWMVEEMNTQCSNKILKILEEPPDKTLFLLVCSEEDYLLETIKSRCQILQINKLQDSEISTHLQETFQFSLENAQSIASFSDGNIIRANEIVNVNNDELSLIDDFIGLMRSSYKKNVIDMMTWANQMAQQGKERQKIFLKYASHMLRQCILKNYVGIDRVQSSKDELKFLEKFSPFVHGNNIRQFMNSIDEAYYQLERNANPKILFTLMCFQSMRLLHKS